MTARQRRSKAKVKRARHKRARVIVDMETCGRWTDVACRTVIDPDAVQVNAYADAHKTAAAIEAGSFKMPPPGVVAENPLRPPSKFIQIKGRWFWKTAREYKRDMDRYYAQITRGAFHVIRLKPGMMVAGSLMSKGQMEYARIPDSHFGVKGPDITKILVGAFKNGKGAVVVLGGDEVKNAMDAGTAVHKAIEQDLPGARLAAADFSCSLYDVLQGYADVIKRKQNGKAGKDRKGK